jgi:hypothetical protein
METRYTPPNILRLVGVKLDQYQSIEAAAEERLVEGAGDAAPQPPDAVQPFDKIPRVFTGLEDWPRHTNLRCWQCDFSFDDRPKFVPTFVREVGGADGGRGLEIGVLGNMCTFACAELWIREKNMLGLEQRWRAQDNLTFVYFLFTGRPIARIPPALNKTDMRQYGGGDLDADTFCRKMRELEAVPRGDAAPAPVPEGERIRIVLRSLERGAATVVANTNTVWGVCGVPPSPAAVAAPAVATAPAAAAATAVPPLPAAAAAAAVVPAAASASNTIPATPKTAAPASKAAAPASKAAAVAAAPASKAAAPASKAAAVAAAPASKAAAPASKAAAVAAAPASKAAAVAAAPASKAAAVAAAPAIKAAAPAIKAAVPAVKTVPVPAPAAPDAAPNAAPDAALNADAELALILSGLELG